MATVGSYQVDDDPGRVDADAAVAFLTTQAYWARWRDAATIRRQIASAWRVVGAYDSTGAMVGFARAFGDGATAYLADVYVLPTHRGAGLGKAIVQLMTGTEPGRELRWMLHTLDAHGLYQQFGFAPADGRYLERPAPAARRDTSGTQQPASGTRAAPDSPAPPDSTGEPAAPESIRQSTPLHGRQVRLEPLTFRHVPGLVAAAAEEPTLYRWTHVPQDEHAMREYVQTALAWQAAGTAAPFAIVRTGDDTVVGCSRLWDVEYWPLPTGHPRTGRTGPYVCEIGHTWLAGSAIRTAANTEAKLLMLALAFDRWQVYRVCFHTDARNERSRAALERIGARFEGVLRGHRVAADRTPRDSARYSILASEWPAIRERLTALATRR